jgi:1-acyl-sn-glycerol-3-phosphate acyltransferase
MTVEPVYSPVIGGIVNAFRVMGYDIAFTGLEHLPGGGGAVVATNHVGYLDFTFIGYGAVKRGRKLRFLAKQEVFDHKVAGPLMRGMHHIPVDRRGQAADSLAPAVEALRAGELVGMFPESTISRSFVPMAGKTGTARMAAEAGVPLIPGAVWGSQRILTKDRPRNLQRGVAVRVAFGAPLAYDADEPADEVTKRLMTRITELVDGLAADYPQTPSGPDDRWWLPAHLGGSAPTVGEAERRKAS